MTCMDKCLSESIRKKKLDLTSLNSHVISVYMYFYNIQEVFYPCQTATYQKEKRKVCHKTGEIAKSILGTVHNKQIKLKIQRNLVKSYLLQVQLV
jgi:hypothetical protein